MKVFDKGRFSGSEAQRRLAKGTRQLSAARNSANFIRRTALLLVLAPAGLLAGCTGTDVQRGVEGFVKGFIGGVAGDEPRAVLAARKVLSSGGSAADAATAMYFTLAVTMPSSAGLGGGGVCLYRDAKSKKMEALNFVAAKPANISASAGRPSAVPGNPLGFFALHTRYGRLRWAEMVSVGEKLARFGTQASRSLVRDLTPVAAALLQDTESRRIFAKPDGSLIKEGDFFRQIDLASSIGNIRANGPAEFYLGKFARQLVDAVRAAGGSLSLEDLRAFKPKWREPISVNITNRVGFLVGTHTVYFSPPPATAGLLEAQMIGMMEAENLFNRANRLERHHVLAEVAVRAFGDRESWLRDDFSVAMEEKSLVSENHLERLANTFNGNRHLSPKAFQPAPRQRPENPSATSFVIIDRESSAVACSLTMNNSFGTGRIAPGTGIMLAAAPTSRGRGPTALGPAMVLNNQSNQLFFAGAASGGIAAPTALTAVLARTMMGKERLKGALAAPRVHHGGAPDITFHEQILPKNAMNYLSKRGHQIAATPILGMVNAAFCPGGLPRDPESCVLGTDPRGSGLSTLANERPQ